MSKQAESGASQGSAGAGAANAANTSDLNIGDDISMNRIVDFLRDQQRANYSRETEFIFEKQQMTTRINQLTAQLKAQENINNDLIKRIKMLEFSLRQERIKYAKLAQGNGLDIGSTDIIGQVLQKANLNTNLYERVAKRRAKAQRPLLLKFLQEIGYDDIFNVNEVKEIKALYDKAQEEMKENFQNELEGNGLSYAEKLEERMLARDEAKEVSEEQKLAAVKPSEPGVVNGQTPPPVKTKSDEAAPSGDEPIVKAKYHIRGHFDQVRGFHYSQSQQVLASASDDCQVKLWNIKSIKKDYETTNGFLEQYMTLRGHTGSLMSITGPKQLDDKVERLLFTAGSEGVIRVWNTPDSNLEEKYPQTNGRNYCVGILSDSIAEPYWQIEYHPFTNMLLAIKSDKYVQVWDCKDFAEKASSYDHSNIEKCKSDFLNISKPTREFEFEVGGKKPSPTCCSWLPTDNNLFAIGYSSGHVAFFNYQTGQLQSSMEVDGEVVCLTAHEFQSTVMIGQYDGKVTIYDFTQKNVLSTLSSSSGLQSISMLNNCLHLLMGFSSGDIELYDLKTSQKVSTIQKAHLTKYDEGVNCVMAIPGKSVPYFVSGGADGMIKMYEHNPYVVKKEE